MLRLQQADDNFLDVSTRCLPFNMPCWLSQTKAGAGDELSEKEQTKRNVDTGPLCQNDLRELGDGSVALVSHLSTALLTDSSCLGPPPANCARATLAKTGLLHAHRRMTTLLSPDLEQRTHAVSEILALSSVRVLLF